jgi:hypothetical protein
MPSTRHIIHRAWLRSSTGLGATSLLPTVILQQKMSYHRDETILFYNFITVEMAKIKLKSHVIGCMKGVGKKRFRLHYGQKTVGVFK